MKDIIEVDVNAFNLYHFKLAMYETLREFCESKANISLIAMYIEYISKGHFDGCKIPSSLYPC